MSKARLLRIEELVKRTKLEQDRVEALEEAIDLVTETLNSSGENFTTEVHIKTFRGNERFVIRHDDHLSLQALQSALFTICSNVGRDLVESWRHLDRATGGDCECLEEEK